MGMRRNAIAILIALASAIGATASRADDITLYSTREANLVEPAIAAFTEESGVKLTVVFVEEEGRL
jgi:iron(III) transport system substrate-binding protein